MTEVDLGKSWIPGTYGLQRPACVATADAVVYRKRPDGEVEIVVSHSRSNSLGRRTAYVRDRRFC